MFWRILFILAFILWLVPATVILVTGIILAVGCWFKNGSDGGGPDDIMIRYGDAAFKPLDRICKRAGLD